MSNIHPTLEAVARAICHELEDADAVWPDYLRHARAAIAALVDAEPPAYMAGWLREIAAEPKPTVEDVLAEHDRHVAAKALREAADAGRLFLGDETDAGTAWDYVHEHADRIEEDQ